MTGNILNLTPDPRILEVIAEVDLQVHHCLAELIDNSLDELRQCAAADPAFEPRIDISLPTGKVSRDSTVYVADNGRGMTRDQLEMALRAGSSGRDMLGSLGMFGMGFNIATGRLGKRTEVRTGRVGDTQWVVALIDIKRMISEKSYEIPLRREPKSLTDSGTRIEITRLNSDITPKLNLSHARSNISKQLGRIYTYMLRDGHGRHSGAEMMGGENLRIYINDAPVRPVLPCIWDPERTGTYKGAEVRAAREINFSLSNAWACLGCGQFYSAQHDECTNCGSSDIELQERRIWGWIGIQRYASPNDFGISFFRQGRCLVDRDKSLFDWDGPDGEVETEYPVEVGGGRIVGELHLDFAKPQIRKTDFDRQSRAWHEMRLLVRGEGPLKPQSAKLQGYTPNESPLADYFNTFRRNDPGLRSLTPGNGTSAIADTSRQWAKRFTAGDPEYMTDEKWYEAALQHDQINAGEMPSSETSTDTNPLDADWLEKEGLGDLTNGDKQGASSLDPALPADETPETEDGRFARYLESARLLPETGQPLRVDQTKVTLRVYATKGTALERDGKPSRFAIRLSGGEIDIFVDEEGELIRDFGWNVLDVAMVFAVPQLKSMYRTELEDAELLVDMLEQFPDHKATASAVRTRADVLIEEIRERLLTVAVKNPLQIWDALSAKSRRTAETAAIAVANDTDWAAAIESGAFSMSLDVQGFRDILSECPELVLDGTVFASTYDALGEEARSDQVTNLAGLLSDLRTMTTAPNQTRNVELRRHMLTAELLDRELRNS